MISDSTGETAAAPRPGARGAVPRPGVLRDPPSAGRDGRRPAARGRPDEGAPGRRRLHPRRARAARVDAHPLPQREAPLLRPARPPDRRDREGVGPGRQDEAGREAAVERRVLPPDVGDRVRGQVRRRRRLRAGGRRHRPRRRLAHLEDAALDLPRLPRLQDRERAAREGDRAAGRAVHDRPVEGDRPDDRRAAPLGDPRRAHSLDARRPQVREPRRDLRRARVRRADAPPARLPGARGERALDRGDLAPDHPARRTPPRRSRRHAHETQGASPEVALGHVVRRARRRARPLLRPLHAVLVRPAGDRLGGGVSFAPPPPRRTISRADGESLRLRLRRADDRRA